jgi:hypothetical protein
MEKRVFIKTDLFVQLGDSQFDFQNQKVSCKGVNGIPWHSLSPAQTFGKQVKVTLKVTHPDSPVYFKTTGHVTREVTQTTDEMGIQFHLSPDQITELQNLIDQYGIVPPDPGRKYPRIPSTADLRTFPLHVLVQSRDKKRSSMIFDLGNLSPGGILLLSENQACLDLEVGETLQFRIEPRGWFPSPVEGVGQVRRILDSTVLKTQNTLRHLGVQFTQLDPINRTALFDLIKEIIEELQNPTNVSEP